VQNEHDEEKKNDEYMINFDPENSEEESDEEIVENENFESESLSNSEDQRQEEFSMLQHKFIHSRCDERKHNAS
jgi:hypothetical protein